MPDVGHISFVGAEESGSWVRTLTHKKREAIRELHRIKPIWNLVPLLFLAIWAAAGALIVTFPSWAIRLPAYVAIGVVIHGFGNLMHEGIHGNLFRRRSLDRWFGFLFGAPVFFSCTAYRVTHLLHHWYNRTERDPDEFTNLKLPHPVLSVAFYVWIVIGMLLYLLHVPLTALTRGTPRERGQVIMEYTLLGASYSALFLSAVSYGFLGTVVHCWIVPLAFAAVIGNVRGWAEHMLTIPGHPLTQTRTVTSSRIFSFLNINLNYHLEHHLFPGTPWYNLPKLHVLLQDEYRDAGSFIYKSYLKFLWDAFRAGVHGLAPSRR
ncbi:MAG: fatty acid desaturase family protein [Candidatus Binatia bacterium]